MYWSWISLSQDDVGAGCLNIRHYIKIKLADRVKYTATSCHFVPWFICIPRGSSLRRSGLFLVSASHLLRVQASKQKNNRWIHGILLQVTHLRELRTNCANKGLNLVLVVNVSRRWLDGKPLNDWSAVKSSHFHSSATWRSAGRI
jgi:hypothetical protein